MTLLEWIYLLFALAIVNSLIAAFDLQSFLSRTPSISTSLDVDNLKRLARQQMYRTLASLGILVAGGVLCIYGLRTKQVSLVLILILNGIVLATAIPIVLFEKRARNLKVQDGLLADQYRAVCETWVKKPFPDF